MKPVLMIWAMSALIAIGVAPRFGGLTPRPSAPYPAVLAQSDGPVAVPGSADAPGTTAADAAADDDQSGQAANNGQTPNDADSAQQPPADLQQLPADDSGDDTSAQPPSENGDEGTTPAAPSSGDDE